MIYEEMLKDIDVDDARFYKDGKVPDLDAIDRALYQFVDVDIKSKLMAECEDNEDFDKVIKFISWYDYWADSPYDVKNPVRVVLTSLYQNNESILDGIGMFLENHPNDYQYFRDQDQMVRKYLFGDYAYIEDYYDTVSGACRVSDLEFTEDELEELIESDGITKLYDEGRINPDCVETDMISNIGHIYKTGEDKDAERVVLWEPDAVHAW